MSGDASQEILLDVTRLIWRRWRGGLPTGVDRVCLAYLDNYERRARAVVQRKGIHLTFSKRSSQELFKLLLMGGSDFRRRLLMFAGKASLSLLQSRPQAAAMYLNVGHTGLDEPSLPAWIARHRLNAVYLIHDLIPITHPQFCRPDEDRKHERRMRNMLASARGIIGNSHATVDDVAALAERLGMLLPDSIAVWLGGNALRRRNKPPQADRPYFVVLGTIEGRKNHSLLLEVWRRLVAQNGAQAPKLLIVGTRGWQADDVFRQLDSLGPLQGFVEERSHCSDEELAQVMAGARALLMPSHAEGYGLPVFEALAFGIPVIATDLPVYREVAGSIPTYLASDDVPGWEDAVTSYTRESIERAAQLKRMQGFKVPNWKAHFAVVEPWLEKLVDQSEQ